MSMHSPTVDRRSIFLGASALVGLSACGRSAVAQQARHPGSANEARYANDPFRRMSDEEWRRRLPAQAYQILRLAGTEQAFTGPLQDEKRNGTYLCRGCELPMFRSEWKYDSGTGWPSFWEVIKENIGTKTDMLIGYARTEYHCARCLGHQGHVFDDGPRPTGLRYCNNGWALTFRPA